MAGEPIDEDVNNLKVEIQEMQFIRFLVPDIVGQLRGKVFPCCSVKLQGEPITISALACSVRGPSVSIPDQEKIGFANVLMRPVPHTLVERTWSQPRHGARICQVMCELVHWDGTPMEEDLRRIAQRQVTRLADRNMEIYSGTEFEFRLYKTDAGGNQVPATDVNQMFLPEYMNVFEEFMVDIEKRMRLCNIRMYTMHPESGPGQVEIPLMPSWGLRYADQSTMFRLLVRETAIDNGFRASFMSKDLPGDVCPNGAHFNHSLWTRQDGESERNILADESATDQLSTRGQNWLAGLMHHARALTALCCPTVNCYRRFSDLWTPNVCDWAREGRLTAFRVKTGKVESQMYIENRLPSSAANPYLVFAGTIAAGLDGIENRLELPPEKSAMGDLPRSLSEALQALKADRVICDALGERFVDWFVTLKEDEISHLAAGAETEPDDMIRERADFLFWA